MTLNRKGIAMNSNDRSFLKPSDPEITIPLDQTPADDLGRDAGAPEGHEPFNTPVRFPRLHASDQLVTLRRLDNGTFRLLSQVLCGPRIELVGASRPVSAAPLPGDEIELRVPPGGGIPEFVRVVKAVRARVETVLIEPVMLAVPGVQAVMARMVAEGGDYAVEGQALKVVLPRESGLDIWRELDAAGALVPFQRGLAVPEINGNATDEEVLSAFEIAGRVFTREGRVAITGLAVNLGGLFLSCGRAIEACRQLLLGKLAEQPMGVMSARSSAEAGVVSAAIGELRKVQGRAKWTAPSLEGYVNALERLAERDLPRPIVVLDRRRPVRFGECFYYPRDADLPRRARWPAKRPGSARYVGTLTWSWGPAHSRTD